MKKLLLLSTFLLVTPLILAVSLYSIKKIEMLKQPIKIPILSNATRQLYAALPPKTGEVLGEFMMADARPVIIEKYLQKHNSPLLPYSKELLNASEKYNVDYRLIVAIAQCESNLCKKTKPGTFNCWGFENGDTHFLSWEQALNQVAKTLKEGYLDQGLTTPEQIMPKYAPPSVEIGGPWAKCVAQFIDELDKGNVE